MRIAGRPSLEVLAVPAIVAVLAVDAAVPAWWTGIPATLAMAGGVALAGRAARLVHDSRSLFVRRARIVPIAWLLVAFLGLVAAARVYVAFRQFQGFGAQEGTRSYDAIFAGLLLGSILAEWRSTDIARIAIRLSQRPMLMLAASFAGLIGIGTLLLVFPVSVRSVEDISLIDAIFTMTSAVCVTGLAVNDVGTTYTGFGQAVILTGIQLGGIGIMTVAAFVFHFRGSVALREQSHYAAMLGADSLFTLRKTIRGVVVVTLAIELVGMFFLLALWSGDERLGGRSAVWLSAFTAISAFCNAGFSLFPDSLVSFQGDTLLQLVVVSLIVCGGLGFPVIQDLSAGLVVRLRHRFRKNEGYPLPPRFALLTRVVLATSGVLVVGGAAGLALLESGGVMANLPLLDRLTGALFTSVTARTAGFNTFDFGAFQAGSLLLVMLLMFVGGSPASTAGGIKTTTAAVLAATVRAEVSGGEPSLFRRALAPEVRRRATAIAGLSLSIIFLSLLGLTVTENKPFLALAFEAVSAFTTTGLSTGITPTLTPLGKLLLIATMFVGRVGPLTIALAAGAPEAPQHRLAQTSLSVG